MCVFLIKYFNSCLTINTAWKPLNMMNNSSQDNRIQSPATQKIYKLCIKILVWCVNNVVNILIEFYFDTSFVSLRMYCECI